MGASQSTGSGETSGGGGEVKTSYYELLGVERTATQDEYVMIGFYNTFRV
jgi:DnaJ family protein A protein 5